MKIHTTFLGGGFGRRATFAADFVSEAVHVAKASGLPVKVIWTREDDIRGGYYRPQWLHRVVVHAGSDGQAAALGAHDRRAVVHRRARPSRR